ncbi:MAG: class IV adenylate cyclase [Planctomycetes bacterium]|jgi:predicted adenylyl cyclase CyaB|nr:class IV adenylate cyclase [Planctomycetota bacterium]
MSEAAARRANVELKARCPDPLRARAVCERLGARLVSTETQTDTYFATGGHRMKVRESSLGRHYVVWYTRPDRPDARKSDYRLLPVPDPGEKVRIFGATMSVKVVVRKERTLWLVGPVRIHLDRVEGLGDFIEFEAVLGPDFDEEAGHDAVAGLRARFGIAEEDLISGSYSDLVLAADRRAPAR